MRPHLVAICLVLCRHLLASGTKSTSDSSSGSGTTGDVAIVSYLPEWRYEGANWETISEHSTHLLLFSLEPNEKGSIVAWDRFPRPELMKLAREATRRHGTKLLICFGGNGRSNGFSSTVRSSKRRARFVGELEKLVDKYDMDGVDYNWEYPGYSFRGGYLPEKEIELDYKGLSLLVKETQQMFAKKNRGQVVTMAYYPDTRQEQLIKKYRLDERADLLHMMSYDQSGKSHSSLEFGKKAVDQGRAILPAERLTMGVPFYGRHSRTGDWTTYEDLVQRHHPLSPDVDSVSSLDKDGSTIGFNGVATIETKTRYALKQGIAGIMIWEAGQDCRLVPVTHGSTTHVRTCPTDDSSLFLAITRAIKASGRSRMRSGGWQNEHVTRSGQSEL
eukprot:TRINITY_DN8139_c0_g1_i1.p1 TRINITY_DN8139_c0_g1~~TRINITY_DN8139_c0_g1_i1.p1  ORF type:complete len:388 (+),score=37.46 TRINITY_DN8139_c0_g1_i1:152-1315(+)